MRSNSFYQWLANCGVTGRIGKEVVLKKYGKKIIVTKYPEKSTKPKTAQQIKNQQLFKEATNYAKLRYMVPEIKEQYKHKLKPGHSLYNVLVREYMQDHKQSQVNPVTSYNKKRGTHHSSF